MLTFDESAVSASEEKTLRDLEWDRLAQAVVRRCKGPRANAASIPLATSFEGAQRALAETREAVALLEQGSPLPLDGIADLADALDRVERNGVLDSVSLRDLGQTLGAAAQLRKFLSRHRAVAPFLQRACGTDPSLDALQEEIARAVGTDGTLLNDASPELERLRTEVANLRKRLVGRLEALIQKHAAILQDSYFTVRDGRYVLPIRADAHERFHGIVHGTSASGATIFIEPRDLVDRGNRLRMAQSELEREEHRILAMLSDAVREFVPQIRATVEALDHADLRSASALFGRDIDGRVIELVERPHARLRSAGHPLLQLDGVKVVPNDLELTGGHALVLSGPNAGGKTVALKTLGLCALMMRAGLPVAAQEGSVCGFFYPVLSCVGDEQNLHRNLSTFSAHIMTVAAILDAAGERVMALLDELASSTDPQEGAALACAVVDTLCKRGAAVAVTTHYEALKALAARSDRMRNAAVGFDIDKMEPTYELMLGIPGASSALQVAQRYGVAQEVIDAARLVLPEQSRTFETLVSRLKEQSVALEKHRAQAEADLAAAATARREAEAELERLRARDHRALSEEANKLLGQVRATRLNLDEASKRLKKERALSTVRATQTSLADASAALHAVEDVQRQRRAAGMGGKTVPAAALRVGDRVWVGRLDSVGEVIEASARGKVRVAAGMMKLWVDGSELRQLEPEPVSSGRKNHTAASVDADNGEATVRTRDNTLDVRGLRVDEALALAETFLDRMYGAAEKSAYILHGVGSGALRQAIHERLATDKTYVRHFRDADETEGGPQLTVVELK